MGPVPLRGQIWPGAPAPNEEGRHPGISVLGLLERASHETTSLLSAREPLGDRCAREIADVRPAAESSDRCRGERTACEGQTGLSAAGWLLGQARPGRPNTLPPRHGPCCPTGSEDRPAPGGKQSTQSGRENAEAILTSHAQGYCE